MKFLKFIIAVVISISFSSCSNSSTEAIFILSNANLAGTYNLSSFEINKEETATSSSGSVVNVSKSTGVADTFDDVNIVLNTSGTFTAVGKYRMVTTETPNGGSPETNSEIIVFDTSGTYHVDNLENTIIFNSSNSEFINGEFTVVTFTENTVNITQENEQVDGGITTTTKRSVGFVRK